MKLQSSRNVQKNNKLPKILGLTASPVKTKIKKNMSVEYEILTNLCELSNNLDSEFCQLNEKFLAESKSNPNLCIEQYKGTNELSKYYENILINCVHLVIDLFCTINTKDQLKMKFEYKLYIANYEASKQLPFINDIFMQNQALAFYLILIIRKGYSLLQELGLEAFLEFLKDVTEDEIENIELKTKINEFYNKYSKELKGKMDYESHFSPKFLKTVEILNTRYTEFSPLSLILFMREKIVCIYFYKLISMEYFVKNYSFKCDFIFGNQFKPTVFL